MIYRTSCGISHHDDLLYRDLLNVRTCLRPDGYVKMRGRAAQVTSDILAIVRNRYIDCLVRRMLAGGGVYTNLSRGGKVNTNLSGAGRSILT
jgi:hypothetical protein